jgi:hypothetical protein
VEDQSRATGVELIAAKAEMAAKERKEHKESDFPEVIFAIFCG